MNQTCSRCKTTDQEFPYTLFGESGQIIKYKKSEFPEFKNKTVCYHCWYMLVYKQGVLVRIKKDVFVTSVDLTHEVLT